MTDDDARRTLAYYQRAVEGHVYLRETIEAAVAAVAALAAAKAEKGDANVGPTANAKVGSPEPRVRILEVGSHTGFLTEHLLVRCPDAEIVVQEEEEHADFVTLARRRPGLGRAVENGRLTFHVGDLASLPAPVDVVLSVARHHHLPHDYLGALRGVMKSDAIYVLADELCPEYCDAEHARRLREASLLRIEGGYVLTSEEEIAAFARGEIPEAVADLERRRQLALWRWYRFVVDEATARGYFDIASAELRSASDDLVTGSGAEHKLSPLVVETQLALAGFRQVSRRLIGDGPPEHQSLVVYEMARS